MSEEQTPPGEPPQGDAQQPTPEQEEMLRKMEEEMRHVRVQDVLTQSVVSLLNLSARRIAKQDEQDLEQGRIGIEAVRALLELLEEGPRNEVRSALSQVQMMYAKHSGQAAGEGAEPAPAEPQRGSGEPQRSQGGGQRKPAPGLWVPGSD